MLGKRFIVLVILAALCIPVVPSAIPQRLPAAVFSDGFSVYDFVPPCPGGQMFVQPDGTTFEGSVRGMEIGGGVRMQNGQVAVMDSRGWWTYSASKENGISLPSSLRVGIDPAPQTPASGGGADSVWLDSGGEDS